MTQKVKWAVLGAAGIARRVIPAMQQGDYTEVVGIASRDLSKAKAAAAEFGIPKAYGSYEEAIRDGDVEAIYIPLPNHLHVPWSIRAAEAGKHVLCEKPIAMSADECRTLIAARDRTGVRIGEAFMIRTHPQWVRVRELVRTGAIGPLRGVTGSFGFFNADPANIRNVAEFGGGALMDIGCYLIQVSRMLFDAEPVEISGFAERDPKLGTDRLTSAVLRFPSGHAMLLCSTQMVWHQHVRILGETGRIDVEVPFNPPPDRPMRIVISRGSGPVEVEEFAPCDQFTIQADAFSRAVLDGGEVPTPLEDSLGNTMAIEAVAEAALSASRQSVVRPSQPSGDLAEASSRILADMQAEWGKD